MAVPSAPDQSAFAAITPMPLGQRPQAWDSGRFVTARRDRTALVEGAILPQDHLVMVTLRGGATRHETVTASGERFDGPDMPGFASFLPAGCERRLRLHDVCWQWAAIAIRPEVMDRVLDQGRETPPPFSNREDPFLLGSLREFERLDAEHGALDATYCDAMVLALAHYLGAGGDRRQAGGGNDRIALPAWKLRRIRDFVEAHLDGEIRIAALADLAGLSEGHFHRVFRASIGLTPLQFVTQRRIEAAKRLLTENGVAITDLAARVGFLSPSHFARTFRESTGVNPARFRRETASG